MSPAKDATVPAMTTKPPTPAKFPSTADGKQGRGAHVKVGDLRNALEHAKPIIPMELVRHHLRRAGCHFADPSVAPAVAFAAQRFLGQIATDAKDYHKLRQLNRKKKARVSRTVDTLTMEDLSPALREAGIDVAKPEYFSSASPRAE